MNETNLNETTQAEADLMDTDPAETNELTSGQSDAEPASQASAQSNSEASSDNSDEDTQPPVPEKLLQIVEAAMLAAGEPLTIPQLSQLFAEHERPSNGMLKETLALLDENCAKRGIELKQVASGFRLQVREELQPWISRLWQERPKRYSRALLETLALIAYRQPVTRAEIEDVRGVSVNTNIIRTMLERDWIREVGHRDVPGRPVLFGTTKIFLDYFNLKSLDELPTLAEIQDLETLEPELALTHLDQPQANQQTTPTDDEDHPPSEGGNDDADADAGADADTNTDLESE